MPSAVPQSPRSRRICAKSGSSALCPACMTGSRTGTRLHGHSHRSDSAPKRTNTGRQPTRLIKVPPSTVPSAGPARYPKRHPAVRPADACGLNRDRHEPGRARKRRALADSEQQAQQQQRGEGVRKTHEQRCHGPDRDTGREHPVRAEALAEPCHRHHEQHVGVEEGREQACRAALPSDAARPGSAERRSTRLPRST